MLLSHTFFQQTTSKAVLCAMPGGERPACACCLATRTRPASAAGCAAVSGAGAGSRHVSGGFCWSPVGSVLGFEPRIGAPARSPPSARRRRPAPAPGRAPASACLPCVLRHETRGKVGGGTRGGCQRGLYRAGRCRARRQQTSTARWSSCSAARAPPATRWGRAVAVVQGTRGAGLLVGGGAVDDPVDVRLRGDDGRGEGPRDFMGLQARLSALVDDRYFDESWSLARQRRKIGRVSAGCGS